MPGPGTTAKTRPAKPVDEGAHKPDVEGLESLKGTLDDTEPANGGKRPPGRPVGAKSKAGAKKTGPKTRAGPAPEPTPAIETIEKFEGRHFTPILKLGFDLIASRFGKQWKLKSGELAELSVASAELMNKRFPNLAQYSAELNFILVLSAIAYPRLEVAKKQ